MASLSIQVSTFKFKGCTCSLDHLPCFFLSKKIQVWFWSLSAVAIIWMLLNCCGWNQDLIFELMKKVSRPGVWNLQKLRIRGGMDGNGGCWDRGHRRATCVWLMAGFGTQQASCYYAWLDENCSIARIRLPMLTWCFGSPGDIWTFGFVTYERDFLDS